MDDPNWPHIFLPSLEVLALEIALDLEVVLALEVRVLHAIGWLPMMQSHVAMNWSKPSCSPWIVLVLALEVLVLHALGWHPMMLPHQDTLCKASGTTICNSGNSQLVSKCVSQVVVASLAMLGQ